MMERRSKVTILVDILRLINRKGKAKPTHILYGANLSHVRLTKYLDALLAQGFIERTTESSRTYYILTPKGLNFLREFKKVQELSDAFGVPI